MIRIILLLIVFFYTNGFAVEQKKITDDEQWSKKVETLNWKNLEQKEHSKEIKKANASILILEEEIYLDNFKDIDQYNWWNTGLAAEKESVMLIRGVGYTIYLDYVDEGYIKLDDWEKVNSTNFLKQMNETAKSNAEYLKKINLDYTTKIDWIFKPTLNKENNSVSFYFKKVLSWSILLIILIKK